LLTGKEYYNYKTAEGDYAYSDAYSETKGLFYEASDGNRFQLTPQDTWFFQRRDK